MKLSDALNQMKREAGMTVDDIASKSGLSISTLGKIMSGQTEDPKLSSVRSIVRAMGRSLDDLDQASKEPSLFDKKHAAIIKKYSALDDRGQKAVESVLNAEYAALYPTQKIKQTDQRTIEIIFIDNALASAGIGEMIGDVDQEKISVPETPTTRRADFAIRVRGDSMEPEFYDDDIVLVRKTDYVDKGRIGIFVVDGDTYIKKCGNNRLISLNPQYPDIIGDDETQIYTMGEVIGKL